MKLKTKLDKNEFSKILKKRKTSLTFPNYELVDYEDLPKIQLNAGVPAMLIRSISQFSGKSANELTCEDAILFYTSINHLFLGKEIGNAETKKFKEKYELNFFGIHQYELLDYFIQKWEN